MLAIEYLWVNPIHKCLIFLFEVHLGDLLLHLKCSMVFSHSHWQLIDQQFSVLLEPNVAGVADLYVSWDPFYRIFFNDVLVWLLIPSNSDDSLNFL